MGERERGKIVVGIVDGVFVHVSPDESVEFKRAPHSFVGIANLATDGLMSSSFAQLLERCFNLISCVEVETGVRGGSNRHHLARLIRGQEFTRQTFDFVVRHSGVRHKVSSVLPSSIRSLRASVRGKVRGHASRT